MDIERKRAQRRAQYRRSREDPEWVEHYRARKRKWALAHKAKPAGEELRPSIPPA
jgi:hypothetical protein